MLDELPKIPGFDDVWGTSAHTCPYCDGFEHRDERLAVLAAGDRAEHLAVLLRQWSDDVILLSNGPHSLAAEQLARVQAVGVPVIESPVIELDSHDGRLRHLRLANGETLDRDALFFYVGWQLRTDLARTLGCELRDDGSIAVDANQATTVDRVYAAGNASDPRALVPAAAGSGTTAAVAINTRLRFEEADRAVARASELAPRTRTMTAKVDPPVEQTSVAASAQSMTAIVQEEYGPAPEAVLRLEQIDRPTIGDNGSSCACMRPAWTAARGT